MFKLIIFNRVFYQVILFFNNNGNLMKHYNISITRSTCYTTT